MLIVYDITNYKTFESAKGKWYPDAASRAPHSVIVIIGTKVREEKRSAEVRGREERQDKAEY